ncbi:hypothetical protein ACFC1I_19310 [Microbacterium sp. NPDC056044]|uniref:hypothetical protein n=1 Tax=Microbacterium sp. NPDC056044 TaxID=3345690 RepID=UPI0035D752EA
MRRHLRWIIPLVLAPVVYVVCALAVTTLANSASPSDLGAELAVLALGAVAFVGPIVLLIVAIVQGNRTYREGRHRRGQFTAAELAVRDETDRRQRLWIEAAEFRQQLLRHEVPPSLQQWELVPYPGEVFFHDGPMTYARYSGTDVAYTQSNTLAVGHPAFVLATLAASAIGNAASRSHAAAQAREQWREWQTTRVLVSNQRLAVLASGQWLSFDYGAMTAIYPEVQASTLVCQFTGSVPMMLQGPHAAFATVMTVFATHGEAGLAGHPQLRALDPILPPAGDVPTA